jgi:peptidoglycan/LPS O-acetylase OafA/YrhL
MNPQALTRDFFRHMPQLDALRGLAILAVIFHNAALHGLARPAGSLVKLVELAGNAGWIGVQLFFVLSGFLITGILLDAQGAPHQLRNFYIRRVLRIFPVYYVFLLIAFVLLPAIGLLPAWLAVSHKHQIWYWLYLINWSEPYLPGVELGHLWSLAVEEQFYILWPFVVATLRPRALVWICLAMIFSAPATRTLLILQDPTTALKSAYMFLPARWDALALGALLAIGMRDKLWIEHLRAWAPRVAFFLSFAILAQIALLREFPPVSGPVGILNQTTSALLFAALIFVSIVPKSLGTQSLQRRLLSEPLRLVGKYSYAMYIFHIPVRYLWFDSLGILPAQQEGWKQLASITWNFAGVFMISMALATVSWLAIEQPFLRMKRHFR